MKCLQTNSSEEFKRDLKQLYNSFKKVLRQTIMKSSSSNIVSLPSIYFHYKHKLSQKHAQSLRWAALSQLATRSKQIFINVNLHNYYHHLYQLYPIAIWYYLRCQLRTIWFDIGCRALRTLLKSFEMEVKTLSDEELLELRTEYEKHKPKSNLVCGLLTIYAKSMKERLEMNRLQFFALGNDWKTEGTFVTKVSRELNR